LGSTGSVGQSTIKVLQAQEEEFDVQVVTANQNVRLLSEQAKALKAKYAVIADETLFDDLKEALSDTDISVKAGQEAIIEAAAIPSDWIMAAIVGMAGLKPLIAALEQGTTVAIANKEPLVAAGELVIRLAKQHGTTILPIDSEHNAVFQVFEKNNINAVERIILTASGGPFRTKTAEELKSVTPEQALVHPNWAMGQKISIDSATMMNKALEVIEAHYLFNVPSEKIDVLVHPQSIIHSMVEYQDGSVLAQMGAADMCTPITNALGWPRRLKTPGQKLDFKMMNRLDFKSIDYNKFPAVQTAYDCLKSGQAACIVMNAANEIAVEAFLHHKIAFLDIHSVISDALNAHNISVLKTLNDVILLDQSVREQVKSCMMNKSMSSVV
jgi:1-deoxy-D-xylulose-5-phosphate reductoisomerase